MPANDPSIWWIFMKQAPFAWLQCQHWGSAISYEYLWGCLQMHNCQGNLTGPSSHMDRDQHLWNARLGFVSEDQFKGNRGRVAVYVAINNWNGVLRYSWRPFSIIYWSITSYNEKGNCYQKKSRTLTPAPTLAGRDMRVKCGRKRTRATYYLGAYTVFSHLSWLRQSFSPFWIFFCEKVALRTHMTDQSTWTIEPKPDSLRHLQKALSDALQQIMRGPGRSLGWISGDNHSLSHFGAVIIM